MPNTTAVPNVLTDPGFLFWAPIGTAIPTNTVVGSVFTDAWPVGFVNLGATEEGSTFSYTSNIEAVEVAELFDPVKYATVSREGSIAFNLASYTGANFKKVMNGGTLTVTGATTTTMTKYTPPAPGAEVRCMIGWESLDATVRLIAYQTINGASIESAFAKAPSIAVLPTEFRFEAPATGIPFEMFFAGVARG